MGRSSAIPATPGGRGCGLMPELLDGAAVEELREIIELAGSWFASVRGGGSGCLLVRRLRWCRRGFLFIQLRVGVTVERS